ncbi:MAG TPA: sulfurtransferase [Rhizomicrobium sp.]|nr:sulfurtransferase [Rhizomicrobium sp.]
MKAFGASLVFATALALASPVRAADPRDNLVVTPSWLTEHAADKDLVILHAGNAASFQAGHIRGAHLADLDQISVSDPQGLSTELPPAEMLRQQLEALGISDNSRILVYSDSETIPRATRILLTLDAAGFGRRSFLLDGGLKEWKAEGRAVMTDSEPVAQGHLKPLTLDPAIVNGDFVHAHLKSPGYDLIDARAPNFFSGEQASMGGKGHIPGARNIPFTTITGPDGKLKSPEELRQMFTSAGYKPGDHVIAYCHIGIQATAVVFAAWTLGLDAKLYDGSFQDWVKRGLPVETGSN